MSAESGKILCDLALHVDTRTDFYIFPYAGAGPSAFHHWQRALKMEVNLTAIALPGREGRLTEPHPSQIEVVADEICAAIRLRGNRKCVFFGHSLGALLAYECVKRFATGVNMPRMLFASGSVAPHIVCSRQSHRLPDEALIKELRRLGGTPEEILQDRELLALRLPVLRADLAMAENYVDTAGRRLSCPIMAYGGKDDSLVARKDLLAWSAHTRARCGTRIFHGGHFFIHTANDEVLRAIIYDLQSL